LAVTCIFQSPSIMWMKLNSRFPSQVLLSRNYLFLSIKGAESESYCQGALVLTLTFIPLQDFSSDSEINWSLPVQEVDKQLYKKYGLTEEEINHIDKKIKDMES